MSKLLKAVDERTKLAGANRLEVLMFSMGKDQQTGREEIYAVNVFKVREVMHVPDITHAPDVPPSVEGMVSLRGTMVPVINLARFCGITPDKEPAVLIVTEYNRQTQGLLVDSVDNILRLNWTEVKVPPPMMANRMGGLITAVTELDDGRIAMILDVEKVLAETGQTVDDPSMFEGLERINRDTLVVFADDSSVARRQIESTLEHLGLKYVSAKNGKEAWDTLLEMAQRAETSGVHLNSRVGVILTDVEMPEMDGYVLTKNIKGDTRFNGIPVIMHSSLSAAANQSLGESVGADAYVAKFDPLELANMLRSVLGEDDG